MYERAAERLTPLPLSLSRSVERGTLPKHPTARRHSAPLHPMPSKILLVNANRCTRPDPVFPLGLTHLSAALRHAGHNTAWLDRLANADRFDEIIDSYRPDFVGISLRNIDDVLIGKRETFFDDAVSLGARIRQKLAARLSLAEAGSAFSHSDCWN